MSYVVKSFDQIVSDFVAYVVANSSQITDLSPGSVIRSFCEAAGLALEEIYIGTYLGFKRYLDNIQETTFGFSRTAGVEATVDVVFSRSGSSGTIAIPAGTRVKTASGLRFVLSSASEIADGNNDSAASEVEADEVGTAHNVGAGTVTVMEDDVDGVETVTNALAATGGVDIETDHSYKSRFQAYIEGLGRSNIAGLIAGALSVSGITSASVDEIIPPVSNGNVKLFVDDGSSGGVSAAKVAEVQAEIDGDGTEASPGYRAAGVNVLVVSPATVTQNITMTATVADGVALDQAETDIITAVTTYVNNLGIGDDIIYNEIVSAVMSVFGVINCSLTLPAADVAITDAQVGRVGTFSVTVS
jgi:uncharacterized phage protein gp47/JayE